MELLSLRYNILAPSASSGGCKVRKPIGLISSGSGKYYFLVITRNFLVITRNFLVITRNFLVITRKISRNNEKTSRNNEKKSRYYEKQKS